MHATVSTLTCSSQYFHMQHQYFTMRPSVLQHSDDSTLYWPIRINWMVKYYCLHAKVLMCECQSTDACMFKFWRVNVRILSSECVNILAGTSPANHRNWPEQKNCNSILRKPISTYPEILAKWWNPPLRMVIKFDPNWWSFELVLPNTNHYTHSFL